MNKIFLTFFLKIVKPAPILGTCGNNIGNCENGYCCSSYNWCGKTPGHCGIGCQSVFGSCSIIENTSTASSLSQPTGTTKLSTDGRCSEVDGSCVNSECCSVYGWCGTSVDHCNNCNPI